MNENKEPNVENNNTPKEVVKRKTNWGFTLFACIATGVIVFLAMNIGEKASKIVDPDTSKSSNVTSNSDSNSNSNIDSNSNIGSNQTTNGDVNSNQTTKLDLKTAFNTFATQKQLSVSKNGYDQEALKKMNCTEALNASSTNSKYMVEIYMFDNSTSAKKEFDQQVNYQKSLALNTSVIDVKKADNYDIFEATIEIDTSKGPSSSEKEYAFMLYVRVDNGYIVMYESSSNSDKSELIKDATALKSMLGF